VKSLHTAARVAAVIGAVGSVALTLYAGRSNNLPFLMVLMAGWVFAPFFGFALASKVSARWSPTARTALDVGIVVIAVAALGIYARDALQPPPRRAVVYVLVPIVSWLLLLGIAAAGFVSRRRDSTPPAQR
jgi:hypothetical protein